MTKSDAAWKILTAAIGRICLLWGFDEKATSEDSLAIDVMKCLRMYAKEEGWSDHLETAYSGIDPQGVGIMLGDLVYEKNRDQGPSTRDGLAHMVRIFLWLDKAMMPTLLGIWPVSGALRPEEVTEGELLLLARQRSIACSTYNDMIQSLKF